MWRDADADADADDVDVDVDVGADVERCAWMHGPHRTTQQLGRGGGREAARVVAHGVRVHLVRITVGVRGS